MRPKDPEITKEAIEKLRNDAAAKILQANILVEQMKRVEKKGLARKQRLIGEACLKAVAAGKIPEQNIQKLLDTFITNRADRAFLYPPADKQESPSPSSPAKLPESSNP